MQTTERRASIKAAKATTHTIRFCPGAEPIVHRVLSIRGETAKMLHIAANKVWTANRTATAAILAGKYATEAV